MEMMGKDKWRAVKLYKWVLEEMAVSSVENHVGLAEKQAAEVDTNED